MDRALELASRSIAIRSILEHWSSATNYDSFHDQMKGYIASNCDNPHFDRVRQASFRITVETYNKHIKQKYKVEKIETMAYLPLEGMVNLKNPDTEFFYIEFYGLNPNEVPTEPKQIFFGKWVGISNMRLSRKINQVLFINTFFNKTNLMSIQIADGNRAQINEISLKTRKFIGNTSMDATLSLLMANQAQVKRGDLVFDPFVGTGSLLVAAAKFGGLLLS